MMLLTKKLEFMTTLGDVMSKELLDKVVAQSKKYGGVDCTLLHNGVEYTITEFTDTEKLAKKWF